MSGIIKSGNLGELTAVRPYSAPPPASIVVLPRQDEERERLRRAVATLESELRQRDAAIDVLRQDVERAFADGSAKGRDAGLIEAQDRQAERLTLLEHTAQAARANVSANLKALERLSALLARDCLDMILGDTRDRAGLVGEIVAAQIGKIDKAMLLGIEVSRADFADDGALATLAAQLGPAALTASAALPSGGCIMTLRLGRMSVGLDQQWGALREVLGDMALPEATP